jgi:hypothetical protein
MEFVKKLPSRKHLIPCSLPLLRWMQIVSPVPVVVINVLGREHQVFRRHGRGLKMESMFDIYTTEADGTLMLVESVEGRTKAEDTALRLSVLFPGESFAYFERSEPLFDPAAKINESDKSWSSFATTNVHLPLPC